MIGRLQLSTLLLVCMLGASHAEAKAMGQGLFSGLSVGETVMIKEVGDKYDLTSIPGASVPYKITGLGPDYIELTLEPLVLRIPVTSIRAIMMPLGRTPR